MALSVRLCIMSKRKHYKCSTTLFRFCKNRNYRGLLLFRAAIQKNESGLLGFPRLKRIESGDLTCFSVRIEFDGNLSEKCFLIAKSFKSNNPVNPDSESEEKYKTQLFPPSSFLFPQTFFFLRITKNTPIKINPAKPTFAKVSSPCPK